MIFHQLAYQDFDRAYRRAFWRKLRAWITGKSNELLPYKQVRQQLPFGGQRDLGLQTVPLEKVVGSVSRYRDFDRAFLPTQRETSQRWVSIRTAHYEDKGLPPIDAYKIGDVYFVKDGNHRVSVARERGQDFIEAYVTEIDVPIQVTPETDIDDLVREKEYAEFMQATGLSKTRSEADLHMTAPHGYGRLLDHIQTHQYYLGLERKEEIPFPAAAASWYDNVYRPLLQVICEHDLPDAFPDYTPTDLYWWVSEYQWLYRDAAAKQDAVAETGHKLNELYNRRSVQKTLKRLQHHSWIDQMILEQERRHFLEYTRIQEIRPGAQIDLSLPGKYGKMLHHISAHRWYLGEEREENVPYEEAVASWYDNAYLPLVRTLRQHGYLEDFPGRTEADLYLWVVDHRQDLVDSFANQEDAP